MALFLKYKKEGQRNTGGCYYPGCSNRPISSHVLQKNGIISEISERNHVYENTMNVFTGDITTFKERGLGVAFTFPGFCTIHDSSIFDPIENKDYDIYLYKNQLLFTIRTLYQELYKKQVGLYQFEKLLKASSISINKEYIEDTIKGLRIGVKEIENLASTIWEDYRTNSESFKFYLRKIKRNEIVLSSYFDYETSRENWQMEMLNPHLEYYPYSVVFVSMFPRHNDSILMLGTLKSSKKKVHQYIVDTFITSDEERLETAITNLMFLQCENWLCSENILKDKLEHQEKHLSKLARFSSRNDNERVKLNLNLFSPNFKKQLKAWSSSQPNSY